MASKAAWLMAMADHRRQLVREALWGKGRKSPAPEGMTDVGLNGERPGRGGESRAPA